MKGLLKFRVGGVLLPLIVLWIALAFATDRFLTVININNILVQFSVIGVLAVGTAFVIIAREIDLSIGAVEGLAAVVAGLVAVTAALPWPLAVATAIAVGGLIGAFNGSMVVFIGVPSFVVTLGTLGIVNGLSLSLTGGQSLYNFPDGYQALGQARILGVNLSVIICVVLVAILHFVLRGTALGMKFYAVGGSDRAARLAGISVPRTKLIAFILSGACAGLAGVLVSARLNAANPTFGTFDLLDAIAAVVIGGAALTGGVGSILGAAAGALLIVTIRNGLNLLGVNPFIQQSAIGLMIIVAALLDHFSRSRRR
jgi:ribose transport system permease protein